LNKYFNIRTKMYTRFKSQKAGLNHGLNQIRNTNRSRVVTPTLVTHAASTTAHNDGI